MTPDRCVFVDDAEQNVAGARAIGVQAILFACAPALRGWLERSQLIRT